MKLKLLLLRISLSCNLLFICFVSSSVASTPEPDILVGKYRFSLEQLQLPDSEYMGLLGGSYLLSRGYFNSGLGVYGAVTGVRGGFFTGGFEVGFDLPVSEWSLSGGVFVGGGGGGSAPQGGGLMLRPHLDLGVKSGQYLYSLSYSKVKFPNGAIDSNQFSVQLDIPFQLILFPTHYLDSGSGVPDSESLPISTGIKQRMFALENTTYLPAQDHEARSGKILNQALNIIGVRWLERKSSWLWTEFSTSGGYGGGIDGFAQVFYGASFRYPIGTGFSLNAGGLFGAAGGGDVDTGGGLLWRTSGGVSIDVYQQWVLGLEGGWTQAVDGGFQAKTLAVGLGRSYDTIGFTAISGESLGNLRFVNYRLRSFVQRYAMQNNEGRKSENIESIPVDLVGLSIDLYMNSVLFLTGQALGAFDGEAGGYAVGLVGAGLESRFFQNTLSMSAELTTGAAGGGGIDVGSGIIVQPMLNFAYNQSANWEVLFATGYIRAPDGGLSSWVNSIGVNYRFAVLHNYRAML